MWSRWVEWSTSSYGVVVSGVEVSGVEGVVLELNGVESGAM